MLEQRATRVPRRRRSLTGVGLIAALVSLLALAFTAVAAADDYTRKIVAGDQSAVNDAILKKADFGTVTVAGGTEKIPRTSEPLCSYFNPKERDLVITGEVMDPRTGANLAMANYPTFNSNDFSTASPDARRNRAVTDAYEPGSTFKIVTIAGALEDNVVGPSTTFTLAPTIQVADRVIHEAHLRGTETMTVKDILAQSSNVGTITIAEKLGQGELASWIDRFGFGQPTGVDFPGESRGLVLPLQDWSGSTIGTVPIGQGIAVTPLQMVSAYATIGNGGVRMTPHLVEKVGTHRVAKADHKRVARMLPN